jgi:hypothetical protein
MAKMHIGNALRVALTPLLCVVLFSCYSTPSGVDATVDERTLGNDHGVGRSGLAAFRLRPV